MKSFPGTEGYAAEADKLALEYERLAPIPLNDQFSMIWPPPPATVCDIGAGTGRDAAAFQSMGYRVLAVEPESAMRAHGVQLHPELPWCEDGLPNLWQLRSAAETFDILYLSGVFMHLDSAERAVGLRALRDLLAPGGTIFISLRHGPVPPGRRMFEVDPGELIQLLPNLQPIYCDTHRDALGRADVSWSFVALRDQKVAGA